MAAANDWEIHHVDVKTAFLNAKMDKEMYIKLPDGVYDRDQGGICRLNLSLYGTKQAGRLWNIKLDKELKDMGDSRSPVDSCVYEWNHPVHGRVFILVYVDYRIVARKSLAGVKAFKWAASGQFDVRDMPEVKDFIGINVMRDNKPRTITLSSPGHTAALLGAFGMKMATPNKNPMASEVKLAKAKNDLLPEGNRCAALVGSLLYLSTMTRPDISFAVGVLSRFMSCPAKAHMRAANSVLRYLCGTTRLGVAYGISEPLQGYVDADWAGDADGRQSTTGFIFTVNGGPVAWASKRQSTVATSAAEAEYMAAATATKEALWLRKLLEVLGVDGQAVTKGEDNQSCFAMINNPRATGRTEHVDVAYHMVRDYQTRGDVAFNVLPSAEVPADGLTKPLPSPALTAFRDALGVGPDFGGADMAQL